jgi:hypothetical protein
VDLGAIKTDLETWLNVVARDKDNGTPLPVQFGRKPTLALIDPFVLVYLGPIGKTGWDFPRYTHDSLTDEYNEQMRGERKLPIRFSFRSFDQEWGRNARQFAEDFRNDLQSTASLEALSATKLSFQQSTDLVETDYDFSGRLISQVDMTVIFGAAGYQRTPATDAGYIWDVNMQAQNHIVDQWGNPVYDSLQNPVIDLDVRDISVTGSLAP